MTFKRALCAGAAITSFAVMAQAGAADAAVHKKKPHHHEPAAAGETTAGELRQLREEVRALQSRLDAQGSQVQAAQATAAQAQSQAQAVQSQVAANQVQIEQLPVEVKTEVAKVAPKTDKIYYKGVTVTLGGFLEAASIYRNHNTGADIATAFNAIPYDVTRSGHAEETRFSARQSRLSMLVEGNPNPDVHLAFYGEFDFQGAAQTANSNESNSYNPRIRHLYGQVDWSHFEGSDVGLHLLAGQSWSLATMNTKGITPRNELTPPQIDAQYVPGFVWARQPQVRLTGDFLNHTLWLAVSAENPQTTINTAGTAAYPGTAADNIVGGSGFNNANTLSLNHVPDVVAKAAYEAKVMGHGIHLEGFGIARDFYARTSGTDQDVAGYGGGFGIVAQVVPDRLDFQVSGLTGRGIGRYGTSQLPDVTYAPNGHLKPLQETMGLVGATVHADKTLDIYAFAGEEHTTKQSYPFGATQFGYGNPNYVNTGCNTEGSALACIGNTKFIDQFTAGFWKKLYQGGWGRLQVGAQYSYTQRQGYYGVGGAPSQNENIFMTSFRYYPF